MQYIQYKLSIVVTKPGSNLRHLTSASDTALHFTSGTSGTRDRIISFPLDSLDTIPSRAINNLTISIQMHVLQSPSVDNDPIVAVCDGTTCNGVFITDASHYPSLPCNYCTFSPATSLTDLNCTSTCNGESVTSTTHVHPKTVTLAFIPHVEHVCVNKHL